MVISHKHKYLFVEVPLTASWAIHNELCEFYGGSPILHKHAAWPEFRAIATNEERDYLVFGAVRHPMDEVVSGYHKLLTDHKKAFTSSEAMNNLYIEEIDRLKYEFVGQGKTTFQDYFKRFHHHIYSNMIDLSSNRLDVVIRFENLQNDFAALLSQLGMTPIRPLPVSNQTGGRSRDWQQYYTADIKEQAMTVFGPFMQEWGYAWPDGWDVSSKFSVIDILQYRLRKVARKYYFTHIRYSDNRIAKNIRTLRARLR
jgi:hypothetical protein